MSLIANFILENFNIDVCKFQVLKHVNLKPITEEVKREEKEL